VKQSLAKLGIVAGAGELPLQIARACERSGRAFYIIAVDEFAQEMSPSLPHTRLGISKIGACLSKLKQTACKEIVFAGKFERPGGRGKVKLRPDWGGIVFLVRYLSPLGRSDDRLHRVFADLLSRHGFRVVSPLDANPDLAARAGLLTKTEPSPAQTASFADALRLAKKHGATDEGQAIVVVDGAIVAREGRAGTDAMLATLAGAKGAILVKAMKPNQLSTMDPPAIGESTVVNAAKAGLAGILVEAGRSVIVDEERVRARADELGLFVFAGRADKA